jgi:dolichol-phosphate mannosyltransferase
MAKEKLKEGWVEKKAPKHVLFIFCFAYVLALALGWLPQTPSQEELYGSGGRFLGEVVQNFMVARGIPWWSSHFMQGYSTANFALCGVPLLMGIIARSLFGDPFGIKVAALMILPLAAFTMFLFVRRLTRNEWTGVVAAILYVTSSQMLLRIGNFEHWMGSYSYIFPPLIFWAFLKISENGSWQSIAWLAFGGASMMLSYSKLTFMFIPLAMAFYIWLLIDRPKQRSILIRGTLLALAGVILMAVIVLLPLTREFRWVAAFSFDNFLGWQRAFSFKNFISVLDRGNALLANMRADFLADRGQFYLGAIVLLSVGSVFWWSRRNSSWLATRQGGLFRLFTGLSLLALWLSQGPFSVFTGAREFLLASAQAPDWIIAVMWLMTLIPVILIPRLLPATDHRQPWVALLILIYLFVPGFVLLEKIPIYQNIRGPWGFWEVGFFAAAVAGALAVQQLWEEILPKKARIPLVAISSILLLVDSGFYLAKFFAPGLPAQTFSDFDRSQEYLRASPIEGRVYPLSGRYFYLRTPMQSGRGLNSEASWSHFQMHGMRALLNGANTSPNAMKTYMRVAGISHVLLDKQDPFTAQEVQSFYTQFYPTGFDSEYIRILENRDSLAPAFLAREYLAMDTGTEGLASGLLDLAGKINVVPIELRPNEREFPYLVGTGTVQGEVQLSPGYTQTVGAPFQRVPFLEPRNNPSRMVFDPPQPRQGWLVVTEAWHPDWRAYAGGHPIPVYKAFGGLMAAHLDGAQGPIRFVFEAPHWYDACVWISALSWLTLLSLLIVMPMPFVPGTWRKWWTGASISKPTMTKLTSSAIGKVLVVIPTYNEKPNIAQVLDRVLANPRKTDVLVVDDRSPDGTAEIVRSQLEFGKKVFLLEGQGKQGLGTACRHGFEWALKNGYGAVVKMDADFSHDPADIPRLLNALEDGAHLAVGSRYLNGISGLNWPRSRILISTLGGQYVRTLTGLPLTDPNSGFKAIRAEVLKEMDKEKVGAEGYAFQIEFHHAVWKQGYTIREIPILLTGQQNKHWKFSVGLSIKVAWRVLRLALSRQVGRVI